MIAEYAVPATLMALMFLGVLIRKIPFMRQTLMPAPVLGGIVGFILMNTGVLDLDYHTFERITFHLFTLSFISITYTSMNQKKKANKGVFKGGLWLALMFGLMISVQALVGSSIFLGVRAFFSDMELIPALGGLVAHGFAQGPGQAVAIGTIWEGFEVENAIQYGLLYAATGYLFAIVVGIPFARWLLKKGKVKHDIHAADSSEKNLSHGVIVDRENKKILGYQTAHHANLDTLSLHFALVGVTYLLAYGFVELITNNFLTGPKNEALFFGNMFAWGILISFGVKKILRKLKFNYIIDTNIQSSITGFLVDFLMLSSLLAINLQLIKEGLFWVVLTVFVVATINFFIVRYFALRSGNHEYERFMTEFGITTGTAATGMLLLRVVDPQLKSPVVQELVWWNILNLIVGITVFMSQIALPVTNFWVWYGIIAASILVFLVLLKVFGLWGKRNATL